MLFLRERLPHYKGTMQRIYSQIHLFYTLFLLQLDLVCHTAITEQNFRAVRCRLVRVDCVVQSEVSDILASMKYNVKPCDDEIDER